MGTSTNSANQIKPSFTLLCTNHLMTSRLDMKHVLKLWRSSMKNHWFSSLLEWTRCICLRDTTITSIWFQSFIHNFALSNELRTHEAVRINGITVYPKKYAHGFCFAVLCCGYTLISPYPSGLLHWHWGNLTIAPVPAKQPWWIWINTSCEFIMNDCITTTKQSTTKPCAYFLGYTVWVESANWARVDQWVSITQNPSDASSIGPS